MNLGSDLMSLSATGSLFHSIGPLNISVCCASFVLQYCGHNLDLDQVQRVAFSPRKLKSKMFEKAGERDLLKYLCLNLAILSSSDCCIVKQIVLLKKVTVFLFLGINQDIAHPTQSV